MNNKQSKIMRIKRKRKNTIKVQMKIVILMTVMSQKLKRSHRM